MTTRHADWRRIGLGTMLALGCASALVLLNDVGPVWVRWVVSLVALAAALGVLVIAEVSWQRAVASAEAEGLVAGADDTAVSAADTAVSAADDIAVIVVSARKVPNVH